MRRKILTFVAVLSCLVTGLFLAPVASASCYTYTAQQGSCFLGSEAISINGRDDDVYADGAYASMLTIYGMDVAVLNTTNRTYSPKTSVASNERVDGANTRTLQIVNYGGNGEFIAAGYTAGCGSPPYTDAFNELKGCTGLNASRGIYKKMFSDGVMCLTPNNCVYDVHFYDVIEGDQSHTYQIQRNLVQVPNGAQEYRFRIFIDGIQRRLVGTMQMLYGGIDMNAEKDSATTRDLNAANDVTYNMSGNFSNIWHHKYGTPSSAPPGLTNYYRLYRLGTYGSFSNIESCTVSVPNNTLTTTGGRC